MYAVIETGGKQYKVAEGDVLFIEKLDAAEGDAVKVVTLINGTATSYCGKVEEGSVEFTYGDMGNIILAPGIYDFYYKVAEDIIYIGGEAYTEEPTYETMELTMTNLEVQDMGEFVLLQASDLNMTGISVVLGVYADGHLHEGSAVDWNGTELPIVEGNITKTVDEEKGDIYAGLVVVEFGEGLMGLDLTMYSAAVEAVKVYAEGATVVVNNTTSTLELATTWEGYPVLVTVAGYEDVDFKKYEGAQISELTIGDDNNWYDFAVADVVAVEKEGNLISIEGEYTSWATGTKYHVTVFGKLETQEPEPTLETVYFVNAANWTTVSVYAWTTDPNASWPGVAATKEAEQLAGYDVYSYTAEAGTYANVIFNNGNNGLQTADLVWTAGKYYVKDGWYTKEEAEAKFDAPVEYESVYFVDNQAWGKANIYTWTPEVGTWPGVAMKKEAEQLAGYDVYSYTVEKGTSFGGLNFNCGGDECKTGDLKWTAGKYYVSGAWYTKEEAEVKLGEPTVITYVLMGVAGDWTTGIALSVNPDNENEYRLLSQTISAGDAVKVVTLTNGVATAWCGNVDDYSVERSYDENGNIILAPGKYDFYYKVSEDLIYIGEAQSTETGLENISNINAPIKTIQNGQFIIIRNGVKYNAAGAVVQ